MPPKLTKTIIGAIIAVALAAAVSYGVISQQTADQIQTKANQSLQTDQTAPAPAPQQTQPLPRIRPRRHRASRSRHPRRPPPVRSVRRGGASRPQGRAIVARAVASRVRWRAVPEADQCGTRLPHASLERSGAGRHGASGLEQGADLGGRVRQDVGARIVVGGLRDEALERLLDPVLDLVHHRQPGGPSRRR